MSHESVCKFDSFPVLFSYSDKEFIYNYKIEKTGKFNEYKISGTAKYIAGQTFTSFSSLSFTLFLVRYRHVAETFGIGGGAGSLESIINFSRTFITPIEFDAVMLCCTGGQARG